MEGDLTVKLEAGIDVTIDGVVVLAVSAFEKENGFVSFSTAPADSGGVAVIVLGN